MKIVDQLPSELRNEVENIGKKLKDAGHNLNDLEGIIVTWGQSVKLFEVDYIGTFDEYLNDIAARDILEIFLENASDTLKARILELVKKYDHIFLDSTEPSTKLNALAEHTHYHKWLIRKPKKIDKRFIDEF